MKQFRYRPPSAGRSLIRNSENHDDEDLEGSPDLEKDSLKKESLKKLKAYINEIIRNYFV